MESGYKVVVRRVLSEDGSQVEIERLYENKDQVKGAIEDMTALLPMPDIASQASLSMASHGRTCKKTRRAAQ